MSINKALRLLDRLFKEGMWALEMPWDFPRFHRSFCMAPLKWFEIINNKRSFTENLCSFVVSNVPADGLAPLGARASAGTMMTKFGHTGPAIDTLTFLVFLCSFSAHFYYRPQHWFSTEYLKEETSSERLFWDEYIFQEKIRLNLFLWLADLQNEWPMGDQNIFPRDMCPPGFSIHRRTWRPRWVSGNMCSTVYTSSISAVVLGDMRCDVV